MTETITKTKKEHPKNDTVMRLEGVSKKYGNFLAVSNINIEVHKGETIGLVGPNGAGKTTTIKMIAQLLRPTEGRILIRNKEGKLQDLNHAATGLVKRGFLIDVPEFYDMPAYDLLKYFAGLQDYPKEKMEERIDELLKQFKLYEWKYENVDEFSKGMKQKLGIIQAIIHDPEIIIMDEPQTGLDPKARIEIRKFIRELQNQGKTIFVASHMLYEISEVCDKIALLNYGNVVAFDTIDNLERSLKTKELNCELLEGIEPQKLKPLLDKMRKSLEPYLDKDLDPKISKIPVKYYPDKRGFKIFYDGRTESRGEILKKLITEFSNDFTVISYTQPKTSQLERIYSQMIVDDQSQLNIRMGK